MTRPRFSKEYRTYGEWLKAKPRDTRYAKDIIRKHLLFPDKNRSQLAKLKLSDYNLSKTKWETLTSLQKTERNKSLQILRAMRKGANLSQMTKKFDMKNKDALRHLGHYLHKENGRWKATKSDSLQVEMGFYDRNEGHITIITTGSKDRLLIAEYRNAVEKTLKDGETERLAKYEDIKIIDANGNEHHFETDLDRLFEIMDAQEEPEFLEIYQN